MAWGGLPEMKMLLGGGVTPWGGECNHLQEETEMRVAGRVKEECLLVEEGCHARGVGEAMEKKDRKNGWPKMLLGVRVPLLGAGCKHLVKEAMEKERKSWYRAKMRLGDKT
jgi:hypothetical protein